MKCSYCGANIPDGELYCPECGAEVRIVPDYNPLEDVLTKQVKGSIDGSTRPLDLYDSENFQQAVSDTQGRRREPAGRSRREAEDRRRQQIAKKKALAKKRRIRLLVILALLFVGVGILGAAIYQTSYSALIKKGTTALGQKNYTAANDYFNRAASKDVTKAEAYTGLADVFVEQDDLDSAENVFLNVITSQPGNADLYKACIEFYVNTKQTQKIPLLIDNCDQENVVDKLGSYVTDEPEFSLEEGNYDDVQEVSLSSEEQAIYYTTDGTDPTASSTKYSEPIQLAEGTTVVKAISVNANDIPSMIVTRTYVVELPVADAPAVSPSTGQHDAGTEITITVPEDYTAYYTTDGTDPTSGSNPYTGAISMPSGHTVFKAVLINSKGKSTQVTTRTYITE
ncbi:MAG: chitobiase/beta-hexosaminidase C-terminal domain-containing protein [Hespellia sp.]|nr:chitobiase/beta-hexosaminidase C-terminal domain-containing protein [Hespellia sp.]